MFNTHYAIIYAVRACTSMEFTSVYIYLFTNDYVFNLTETSTANSTTVG